MEGLASYPLFPALLWQPGGRSSIPFPWQSLQDAEEQGTRLATALDVERRSRAELSRELLALQEQLGTAAEQAEQDQRAAEARTRALEASLESAREDLEAVLGRLRETERSEEDYRAKCEALQASLAEAEAAAASHGELASAHERLQQEHEAFVQASDGWVPGVNGSPARENPSGWCSVACCVPRRLPAALPLPPWAAGPLCSRTAAHAPVVSRLPPRKPRFVSTRSPS